jgi:hypothetical protein
LSKSTIKLRARTKLRGIHSHLTASPALHWDLATFKFHRLARSPNESTSHIGRPFKESAWNDDYYCDAPYLTEILGSSLKMIVMLLRRLHLRRESKGVWAKRNELVECQ